MQKSLELAISRFEAGDITGVVVSIITTCCLFPTRSSYFDVSFQGIGSPNASQ